MGCTIIREVNMWSSAGSSGVANSSDLSKIVFAGSIAQLGIGIGGIAGSASAHIEVTIGLPKETATLRYPVHQADLGDGAPAVWNLTVRYRDGNGSVTIQLIQVAVATGNETVVVVLQSGVGYNRSNSFHNEISQGTFGTNFDGNVYYVAVTMTAPIIELGVAPAIQLMQIGPA
jgi:hypothetical protein